MATYRKGIDYLIGFEERLNQMNWSAKEAHKQIAAENYSDARELVSGKLTPAQTKGAFARRRAQGSTRRRNPGQAPLLPINVQTGLLRRGFSMRLAKKSPQTFILNNRAPYAKYVLLRGGTRFMVDRGFLKETDKRFRARNKAFRDYYIRKRRIA